MIKKKKESIMKKIKCLGIGGILCILGTFSVEAASPAQLLVERYMERELVAKRIENIEGQFWRREQQIKEERRLFHEEQKYYYQLEEERLHSSRDKSDHR